MNWICQLVQCIYNLKDLHISLHIFADVSKSDLKSSLLFSVCPIAPGHLSEEVKMEGVLRICIINRKQAHDLVINITIKTQSHYFFLLIGFSWRRRSHRVNALMQARTIPQREEKSQFCDSDFEGSNDCGGESHEDS